MGTTIGFMKETGGEWEEHYYETQEEADAWYAEEADRRILYGRGSWIIKITMDCNPRWDGSGILILEGAKRHWQREQASNLRSAFADIVKQFNL